MCRALVILLSLVVPPLAAQSAGAGRPGPRPLLPAMEEMVLARSAAPASVAAGARIWVLTGAGWVIGDSGTTTAACLVGRSWPAALEPACYDAEAAATILPMEMRRTELLHQGRSVAEVEADIARGLLEGRFRLPSRMAVVYMMSSRQQLISDAGRPAGAWRPHLMIYAPYLTTEQVGHAGVPGLEGGMVVDPGKPTANLLVVVPAFAGAAAAAP